mgnify:CR=1 FL=1
MPRYIAKPSALKRLLAKITHLFKTRVLRRNPIGNLFWLAHEAVPDDLRTVELVTKQGVLLNGYYHRGFVIQSWFTVCLQKVEVIAWREL